VVLLLLVEVSDPRILVDIARSLTQTGAVGIEIAAEVKSMTPNLVVTLIHSRDKLLSSEPLPDQFKEASLQMLRDMGIRVILERRVQDIHITKSPDGNDESTVILRGGEKVIASHVIEAISQSKPTTSYLPSDALDEDGLVRVDKL
jgi:thioredoxin reductase